MPLPVPANTTCDIFRNGAMPPLNPPAVADVPCFLKPDWRGGQEAGERSVSALAWTHVMLVDVSVDIRDGYIGGMSYAAQDAVYIPDDTATKFNVIFIERVRTAPEHKRVYLDRQGPTWPTNDL